MGYGIFSKPDVHVMDLIRRLNLHLYYEWGNDEGERATYLLSEMAKAASTPECQLTANQVDKVFWLLKSGNYHIHQLSKRFLLSDTQCSDICKRILRDFQDKGICSAVEASWKLVKWIQKKNSQVVVTAFSSSKYLWLYPECDDFNDLGRQINTSWRTPLSDLWTTCSSQGKKTLTNPYDRSLIPWIGSLLALSWAQETSFLT